MRWGGAPARPGNPQWRLGTHPPIQPTRTCHHDDAQTEPMGWLAPIFPVVYPEECLPGSWKLTQPACRRQANTLAMLTGSQPMDAPLPSAPERQGFCVQVRTVAGVPGAGCHTRAAAVGAFQALAAWASGVGRAPSRPPRKALVTRVPAGQAGPQPTGLHIHLPRDGSPRGGAHGNELCAGAPGTPLGAGGRVPVARTARPGACACMRPLVGAALAHGTARSWVCGRCRSRSAAGTAMRAPSDRPRAGQGRRPEGRGHPGDSRPAAGHGTGPHAQLAPLPGVRGGPWPQCRQGTVYTAQRCRRHAGALGLQSPRCPAPGKKAGARQPPPHSSSDARFPRLLSSCSTPSLPPLRGRNTTRCCTAAWPCCQPLHRRRTMWTRGPPPLAPP